MSDSEDIERKIQEFKDMRDMEVKYHNLVNVNERYNFYYDETNNIRKLHIKHGRFNVTELNDFILGGIVYKGELRSFDISNLKANLKLHSNVNEIKLKHLAQGNFLEILRAEKLTIYLEWLRDNQLLIHYHHLDPFFWSIVDIVDTIIAKMDDKFAASNQHILKFDLYEILKANVGATLTIFEKYNYPGLLSSDRTGFVEDLLSLIDQSEGVLSKFNHLMLKGVIQFGKKLDTLDLIEDNPSKVLIDNFGTFYKSRIRMFDKSVHILDDEPQITSNITDDTIFQKAYSDIYRFSDSSVEVGIQLSDIIVGVIGKMHTYLRESTNEDIKFEKAQLDSRGQKNIKLLTDLISVSGEESNAFLHHVASGYDLQKFQLLV